MGIGPLLMLVFYIHSFSPHVDQRSICEIKHKTFEFGVRDVLKLKKVEMANIMSPNLTLIVACVYSLEIFLWYSSSILGYISITLALVRQLCEHTHTHTHAPL